MLAGGAAGEVAAAAVGADDVAVVVVAGADVVVAVDGGGTVVAGGVSDVVGAGAGAGAGGGGCCCRPLLGDWALRRRQLPPLPHRSCCLCYGISCARTERDGISHPLPVAIWGRIKKRKKEKLKS